MIIDSPPIHEREEPLWLEIDALPHNSRYEYQVTSEGGQLFFPGEERTWDVPPNPKIPEGMRLGGQRWIIWAMLNYKVVTAPPARRVGKTTTLPQHHREAQGRHKGMYMRGSVAVNHTKAKELMEMVLKVNGGDPKKNPRSLVKAFHRADDQDRWIEFGPMIPARTNEDGTREYFDHGNTGSKWYFWSGTNPYYKDIQGFPFAFDQIDVDETQLQHPNLITEIVVPMLTDSGGRLYLTGHPKRGMPGNALFRTYYDWGIAGMSGNEEFKDFYSIQMPAEANPLPIFNQETGEYEDRIPLIRRSRAQCMNKAEEIEEYDGGFVSDSGGVFDNLEAVFTLDPLRETPYWYDSFRLECPMPSATTWFHEFPNHLMKYAIGVDWARKVDNTIISVMNCVTNQQAAVIMIRGEDWDLQLQWVDRFREMYNNAVVHGDETGVGDAMGNTLMRNYKSGYVGHVFSGNSTEIYVRQAQIFFKEGLCELINIPEQRSEFRNFSVIPAKSDDGYGGKNLKQRFGHVPREHDDFVYAFLALTQSLAAGPQRAKKEAPKVHKRGTYGWLKAQDKKKRRMFSLRKSRIG